MAAEKKWDARNMHAVPHTNEYNMQVDPAKYKGLIPGLKLVAAEEGLGVTGLCKGWLPTLMGYSVQGFFKFGLYEFFKDTYMNLAGEELATTCTGPIWLAASASAEFVADIGLCPLEMVKVKVQTSPKGTFPTQFGAAWAAISADSKSGFPFGSLVPLWSRQIPYTMAKFYFFEKVVQLFYTYVFTNPKDSYSKQTQLGVTFASGYTAGVVCAIVSHPADTLVSQKGKAANFGKSFGQIANEVGMKNLCTKGLGTRVLMIGTLTGLQWWIYDTYKSAMGLGTTGGVMKKKN
jgi:solute carrier family 25 (mitochondrial phosphate transporter), member 3